MTTDEAGQPSNGEARVSCIANVLVRLEHGGVHVWLLRKHAKWNDWSLVGGHVEPEEVSDWKRAAEREAAEEMAPLASGTDFWLTELPFGETRWGPELAVAAGGRPTFYRARWYLLSFAQSAERALASLGDPDDFILVHEDQLLSSNPSEAGHPISSLAIKLRTMLAELSPTVSRELVSGRLEPHDGDAEGGARVRQHLAG